MSSARWKTKESQTIWYNPPEENVQFLKEERIDGATYHVLLKKVRYHTSPDEVNLDDERKAVLQWKLEEVRVIKSGTLPRLVEALSSETGVIDSLYVYAFLATYRTFATTSQVVTLLLERYLLIADDMVMKQPLKDCHKRSIRAVILGWLDTYPEDFKEPPPCNTLYLLARFAQTQLADEALVQRLKLKISECERKNEVESETPESPISQLLSTCVGGPSESTTHLYNLFSKSSRVFAEQLTYVDSELFKRVIPYQCLGSVWSRRRDKQHGSDVSSVFATVEQFNRVSCWVIATILKSSPELSLGIRAHIVEHWIDVAQELRILKNFSSLKAIISGLQSTAVFRLTRVWALVSKAKQAIFSELAEIFSEENNQEMCREVLYREGTAKFADPDTVRMVRVGRRGSGPLGMMSACFELPRRTSAFDTATPKVIQGTVPYLGTFLTDLTMIDTAFRDHCGGQSCDVINGGQSRDVISCGQGRDVINFDKCRKEFEILTQIRMLQCAAGLYSVKPDPRFLRYFLSLPVSDNDESYQLSCKIQSDTASVDTTSQKHRRHGSLSYCSGRRSSEAPSCWSSSVGRSYFFVDIDPDEQSLRSLPNVALVKSRCSKERESIRHTRSVSSLLSRLDRKLSLSTESLVAKVYCQVDGCSETNQYKSIRICSGDRTPVVVRAALQKYTLRGEAEEYCLFQQLRDSKELLLPDKMNAFYAIDTSRVQIILVLRRKMQSELLLPVEHRKR